MPPKYIAYAVTERGEGDEKKSNWVRIGAAFENKDESLTVRLDAVPTNGKLLLQVPKEKEPEEASA